MVINEYEEVNYCNTCPSGTRGLCCWFSAHDGEQHIALEPCQYLTKAGRCKIYKNRYEINPMCQAPTLENIKKGYYPAHCQYVINSKIIPDVPYKIKIKRGNKIGI